jgi:hypothetical protein
VREKSERLCIRVLAVPLTPLTTTPKRKETKDGLLDSSCSADRERVMKGKGKCVSLLNNRDMKMYVGVEAKLHAPTA